MSILLREHKAEFTQLGWIIIRLLFVPSPSPSILFKTISFTKVLEIQILDLIQSIRKTVLTDLRVFQCLIAAISWNLTERSKSKQMQQF